MALVMLLMRQPMGLCELCHLEEELIRRALVLHAVDKIARLSQDLMICPVDWSNSALDQRLGHRTLVLEAVLSHGPDWRGP
jgi:hypothetical protein